MKKTVAIAAVAMFATAGVAGYWYYQEHLSLVARQRAVVKKFLFNSESARFQHEMPSLHAENVWCGEVNAKNRLGRMMGFTRYVAYLADTSELANIQEQAYLDEGSQGGNDPTFETAIFRRKWMAFCE